MMSNQVVNVIYGILLVLMLYAIWYFNLKAVEQVKVVLDEYSSSKLFDDLLLTFVIALFIARIGYIFANWDFYSQFGFFVLPYMKFKGKISFLEFFPWRIFRIYEGVDKILLYITWLFLMFIKVPFKLLLLTRKVVEYHNVPNLRTRYIYFLMFFIFVFISTLIFGKTILLGMLN